MKQAIFYRNQEKLDALLRNAKKHLEVPTSELYSELAMTCSILEKYEKEDYYDELTLNTEEKEKINSISSTLKL